MKQQSDIEILENFNSQSNKAIEEFYNRYSHLVYGVCLKYFGNKEESLDAVIEVFEQLITKIPKHKITNFSSWLYSLTKNHCLMKIRKDKIKFKALKNLYAEQKTILTANNDIEEKDGNLIHKVEKAICQLPIEQKQCIIMFYYQQKSYVEISNTTGYNENLVKSYLQNGKIKLKKILEE